MPANCMSLFLAGMLLAICICAPRAAADVTGGRFTSGASQHVILGLTFDQVLGLLIAAGAILFVVYLWKRR